MTIKIGALISGGGTNLQAIIDACEKGTIDGRMVFVGSDNPAAGGLERAARHNIPTFVADYRSIIGQYDRAPKAAAMPQNLDLDDLLARQTLFKASRDAEKIKRFFITRVIAEAKLMEQMQAYPFDLLILAGFMRNLTPYFIDSINADRETPRIMNIHPALLPAFAGVDGYGDTFRYGCKVGGCTVHFIDYGEDSGPIIGQRCFQIQPGNTLASIRAKGLELEWELYPRCIQQYAQGRLRTVKKTYESPNGRTTRRTVVEIMEGR
jgi:phosphoribosylglycinamide formyltransferase-1